MTGPAQLSELVQAALDALCGTDPELARYAEERLAMIPASPERDPIDCVNIMLVRARLKARIGEVDDAAEIAGSAVGAARQLVRDETSNRLLAQGLADWADFRTAAGLPGAGELLGEALRVSRNAFGEHDADTVSIWNSLGMRHRYRGQLDAAEHAYRMALAGHAGVGSDQQEASILHNLASLSHLRGDVHVAEDFIHRALALRHNDGLGRTADLAVLAAILGDLDRYAEASDLYMQVRELLASQYGDESAELVYLDANVAVLTHRRGDLAGADRRYQAALARTEQVLGTDHPQVGVILANLAQLAADRGDAPRMKRLADRAVTVLQPSAQGGLPALELAKRLAAADN